METFESRVRTIIVEHLGVEPDQVTRDAILREDAVAGKPDLGADSLDIVELQIAFEEEFNIEIEDSKISSAVTVGDCIDLIEYKVSADA